MAISINWNTRVITIPKSFMTMNSATLYTLDVNAFRIALKDIEDGGTGIVYPDTHRHNSPVTLAGVTYARSLEIINGYTVTFEDGQYVVKCEGANHNIADVKNLNQVSLIVGNAAGLISVNTGGGVGTVAEVASAVWDATQAAHTTSGSMGAALSAAGTAGDPWIANLASYTTPGTAGKILNDTGTIPSQVWTNSTRTLTDTGISSSNILQYKASNTTTDSDPGTGRIRWNNVTQASSTQLYLDHVTNEGLDISAHVGSIIAGTKLIIQDKGNSGILQKWVIASVVENVGYITLNVALTSATGGNIANNAITAMNFKSPVEASYIDPWTADLTTYSAGTAGAVVQAINTNTDTLEAGQLTILNAVNNVSVSSSAINAGAVGFTLTQGTVISGTYTDTRTYDAGSHVVRDNAMQFDCEYMFDIGLNSIPSEIVVTGYIEDKHETMNISAWNYKTSAWEIVTQVTGANTNKTFTGVLYNEHVGFLPGQIGDVRIRLNATVLSDLIAYIDQMYISYATIEKTTGYSGHAVAATSTSIQLGSDASSVNNYYVPALLMVNHGTGALQYAKVIGYVGSTKTLQLELPMATTLDTTSHITLQPWASANMPTTQYNNLVSQVAGLTPTQVTMLTEIYDLMGLDMSKPLVVTKTARTAGTISQSIAGDTNSTTVTRL